MAGGDASLLAPVIVIAALVIRTAITELRHPGTARRQWGFATSPRAMAAGATVAATTVLTGGRVPARLRARFAPVRVHGWAILAVYAVAPLNAIPRLAGASPELSLALTAAAGIVAAAGWVLGLACLATAENGAP